MLINIGESVVCGVFDCFSVKSSFNSLNEKPVIKRFRCSKSNDWLTKHKAPSNQTRTQERKH